MTIRLLTYFSLLIWINGAFAAQRHPNQLSSAVVTSQEPQEMNQSAQPSDNRANLFSNLALGFGIGTLVADAIIIYIALLCFGGCSPVLFAVLLTLAIGLAVTTFITGIRAINMNRSDRVRGINVKSIIGMVLGGLAGGYALVAFFLNLRDF